MSKGKSAFVTGLVSVMLLIIVVWSKFLFPVVFEVLVDAIALVGFVYGASGFYKWVSKPVEHEHGEEIPELVCGDPVVLESCMTCDEIIEEVLNDS